jgi:hypothetical protein
MRQVTRVSMFFAKLARKRKRKGNKMKYPQHNHATFSGIPPLKGEFTNCEACRLFFASLDLPEENEENEEKEEEE